MRHMNRTLVQDADTFAEWAHGEQKRKYTGEAYIMHPREVAEIVASVTDDDVTIAAALLHDVVEDTGVSIERIEELFGFEVAEVVYGLTDQSLPTDGNRAVRKAIDREHLANGCERVHTIKLADMISNTRSILRHDRNFAKVYLKEKAELLKVLTRGNKDLMRKARNQVEKGCIELGI